MRNVKIGSRRELLGPSLFRATVPVSMAGSAPLSARRAPLPLPLAPGRVQDLTDRRSTRCADHRGKGANR